VCVFYLFIDQWALDVPSICMEFSYLLAVVLVGYIGQVVDERLPVLIFYIQADCHRSRYCPVLFTLLCSDDYVILGFASPGVGSMNLCFILLDICRGMAASRIPVSFYVVSFDERLTCRISVRGYQLLRATWFAGNLSVMYFSENIRCLVSQNSD
jgi:hypothetical protein